MTYDVLPTPLSFGWCPRAMVYRHRYMRTLVREIIIIEKEIPNIVDILLQYLRSIVVFSKLWVLDQIVQKRNPVEMFDLNKNNRFICRRWCIRYGSLNTVCIMIVVNEMLLRTSVIFCMHYAFVCRMISLVCSSLFGISR